MNTFFPSNSCLRGLALRAGAPKGAGHPVVGPINSFSSSEAQRLRAVDCKADLRAVAVSHFLNNITLLSLSACLACVM